MAISTSTLLPGLVIVGKTPDVASESIMSAEISMSSEMTSQLVIAVDDPGYKIFTSWKPKLDTWLTYKGLNLTIAAVETNEGDGEGGFRITARPLHVRRLRRRRGTLVMKNVSPSDFVRAECRAVGAKAVVQPSSRRSSVARDTPPKGSSSSEDYSSWSTFSRLASEIGFAVFEVAGTVYFGKPSWTAKNATRVKVTSGSSNDAYAPVDFPTCTRSLDDNGRTTVTVKVPAERSTQFYPGYVLVLSGVPTFSGSYFITEVDYPIVGLDQAVTITAETIFDPKPTGI